MKKLIFIALLALAGCTRGNVEKKNTEYVLPNGRCTLKIVIIDSCEYLYLDAGYSSLLTHKGNCKNCRKWNKEK